MQTGRPRARRVARSRLAENDTTHTRSQALVRRSTSGSGAIAGTSFTSRLNRTSGQAASRSSSSGIGSVPSIRAADSSAWLSRRTRPSWPQTRVSVLSWKATSTPSAVAWRSVSRYR